MRRGKIALWLFTGKGLSGSQTQAVCDMLYRVFEEALINSAPPPWRIFSALLASINPPHNVAMRSVYFLDRTKNLHQVEGLFYQCFLKNDVGKGGTHGGNNAY